MNDFNEKLLSKLDELIRLLKPISYVKSSELGEMIEQQFLTTPDRKKVYGLFDGKHSQQEIAKKASVDDATVSRLVSDLESKGLIEIKKKGRSKIPVKIY
jgi:DNA-binding MarR family transcriptional regulator